MAIPDQSPDSTQPGYLQPHQPHPNGLIDAGDPLENYLQQWVAGVAYIEETHVRPRWQLVPPNLPDVGVDWCAIGITNRRPVGIYPAHFYFPDSGLWQLQRHEEFELLVTFYGPHADVFSSHLHDGACLWQNYHPLRWVGIALVEVHESRRVPELVKNQWLNRVDKEITFRRAINRNYPVLPLLGAQGYVHPDPGHPFRSPFTVAPPPPPPPPIPDAPHDDTVHGRGDQRWHPALPAGGGTMQGPLGLGRRPVAPDDAVDKRYIDRERPLRGEEY